MRRTIATLAAAMPQLLAGCSTEPSSMAVTGDNPGVNLHVRCQGDGVTAVATTYDGLGREVSTLVTNNPGVINVFDGTHEVDQDHRLHGYQDDAALVVDVAPAEGTCVVTLTDIDSGETLVRETQEDKDFTLEASITRG